MFICICFGSGNEPGLLQKWQRGPLDVLVEPIMIGIANGLKPTKRTCLKLIRKGA